MKDHELQEHLEGGRFKQVYRSETKVIEGTRERRALTHIYFSLGKDEVSRFHKVENDEVWNLYEGKGLVLYLWDGIKEEMDKVELSTSNREYCHVVKAGLWQAAVPIDGKVLVGCSVAPGFEYPDFELMDPAEEMGKRIIESYPELIKLVEPAQKVHPIL